MPSIGLNQATIMMARLASQGQRLNAVGIADDIDDAMSMKLALLPSLLVATQTSKLPLSAAQITTRFGQSVSFVDGSLTQNSTGIVTSFQAGASPIATFLLRALCITGVVEPFGFSLRGAALAQRAAAVDTPAFNGVVPAAGLGDAADRPGSYEFGYPTWRVMNDFLNGYQFRYSMNGRFLLVNERAADMGFVDSHQSICGFGTGEVPALPWINLGNAHLGTSAADGGPGTGRTFIPPTVDASGDPVAEPMAQMQWGQLCSPGVYGTCYPVMPHVLFPGQQYQWTFERQSGETDYHDRLVRDAGDQGLLTYGPNLNAAINGVAGFAASIPLKFGMMRLGIMARGYEVTPWACLQWWFRFGRPYQGLYGTDRAILAQLDAAVQNVPGLAGLPVPLRDSDVQVHASLAGLQDEVDENKKRQAMIDLMNDSRSRNVAEANQLRAQQ